MILPSGADPRRLLAIPFLPTALTLTILIAAAASPLAAQDVLPSEPLSKTDEGKRCELPMTKVTAMVSPSARPRPSITAPMALRRT